MASGTMHASVIQSSNRAIHVRPPRYSFVANVDLTDLQSETGSRGQIVDLSLFGCRVAASEPLPAGARVRIKVVRRGAGFEALGRVAYVRDGEMGVVFTHIEQNDLLLLDKWISEMRETPRQ